jgi:HEPN domain-containing protein
VVEKRLDGSSIMRKEAERWLRQAEADLKAARLSFAGGSFEWPCFQAQQGAEKALKAFLYDQGRTGVLTHSLRELLRQAQHLEPGLASLAEVAVYLDQFYLAARYPNALAGELTPAEYYEEGDAQKCLSSCESILSALKNTMKD